MNIRFIITGYTNGKYGVCDLQDNVIEYFDKNRIISMSKKIKIYGITGNNIRTDWLIDYYAKAQLVGTNISDLISYFGLTINKDNLIAPVVNINGMMANTRFIYLVQTLSGVVLYADYINNFVGLADLDFYYKCGYLLNLDLSKHSNQYIGYLSNSLVHNSLFLNDIHIDKSRDIIVDVYDTGVVIVDDKVDFTDMSVRLVVTCDTLVLRKKPLGCKRFYLDINSCRILYIEDEFSYTRCRCNCTPYEYFKQSSNSPTLTLLQEMFLVTGQCKIGVYNDR